MQKRLQVFISSTFEDMRPEREAAIKAILQAKHVPAGMEMFAAGNESQWDVIKQWIDACDVFLLIVGGRYGSIEPTSGKSYIELEYDYAEQQCKELFAIVMTKESVERKVQAMGSSVIETANGPKLDAFKERVGRKMSGRCDDTKDISLEIFKALMEIVQKDTVQGWVRGGEFRKLQIQLEAEIQKASESASAQKQASEEDKHASFENLCRTLEAEKLPPPVGGNLLDVLKNRAPELMSGIHGGDLWHTACPMLEIFGLLVKHNKGSAPREFYGLSDSGRAVVATLRARAAGVKLE